MSAPGSSHDKEQDDNAKPLWAYVNKIKKMGTGGGNYENLCTFCESTFNGSYTRVRAHLLKITGTDVRVCQKIKYEQLQRLRNLDSEYTLKMERMKSKPVSLPPISSAHQDSSILNINVDPKKRKTSALESAFNVQGRETLDAEIARMFYSAGLPFNLARNPHFRKAFAYAANNSIPGYLPPGYNKLRTTLLQNEQNHVENLLQPIKNTWSQKGVTIVSDGWSDPQRRPLINFMAVTER